MNARDEIARARASVLTLETETHRVQRRIREGMTVADAMVAVRAEIQRVARELTEQLDDLTPQMSTGASQTFRAASKILQDAQDALPPKDEEPITVNERLRKYE